MTRISEHEWIAYYGFQHFPFDRPEAGNEVAARPDLLASCFVRPACFDRILGQTNAPVSSLLWARRGSGKTACRVMVGYYCQTGLVPGDPTPPNDGRHYVLSIPHIDLYNVVGIARVAGQSDTAPVRAEHHVYEILGRAMPAFVDLIAQANLDDAARQLSDDDREELRWLIGRYRYRLTPAQVNFLHGLGLWEAEPEIGYRPTGRRRAAPKLAPLREGWAILSPFDHLKRLATLARALSIPATYILIDGVDEFPESAGNPQEAYAIIRPLLAMLGLMDSVAPLALKFFLPTQLEPYYLGDHAVRKDRGFIVERLHWGEDDLVEILRRRLSALRIDAQQDRLVTGFEDLCVPELRDFAEAELARRAAGNPRYLILLCGLMVKAHCAADAPDQADPYQLNRRDMEQALADLAELLSGGGPPPGPPRSLSLLELITQGEHERLEFKASAQWNTRTNSADTSSRVVIARAIAGLMNRAGGHLLIGVANDSAVVGIENDLITTKGSRDRYQLLLEDIVRTHIGLEFAAYKQIRFEPVGDKVVCVIEVRPAPEPVFLYENSVHNFYVRFGNATRKLDTKETQAYIKTQWGR